MNEREKDSIYYFCSLIEFIGRVTKNRRSDVIRHFSEEDIRHELEMADLNHTLSFEQVSDEIVEDYKISEGEFDTVKECKYSVPSVLSIGRVYQQLILAVNRDNVEETVRKVFSSFISDEISDFNSNVYYSNPDYILKSYEADTLLA